MIRKMLRIQFFSLLLLCVLLHSENSVASGPAWPISDSPRYWILGPEAWHASFEYSLYHTISNYNIAGDVVQPTLLSAINYMNPRLMVGYGVNREVSVFAQLSAIYLQENNISPLASDAYGGFGDAFVAVRWQFYRLRKPMYYSADWLPHDFQALFEGSWNFPLYTHIASSIEPHGNESNDFTGMIRLAWYVTTGFAASGGVGFTERSSSYSPEIPYFLRFDFIPFKLQTLRFWIDYLAENRLTKSPDSYNVTQSDALPDGSFLFKTSHYTEERAGFGSSIVLGREWEIAGAYHGELAGVSVAKGWELALALSYRPYKVPAIQPVEENRREELERTVDKFRLRHATFHYGFIATILKVSEQGHYFKIEISQNDSDTKVGDSFHVFRPISENFPERLLIAEAKVVRVEDRIAFLRVEEDFMPKVLIAPGFEAQRIISVE